MDTSYLNYLDQSSAKRKEAQDYLASVPALREQGAQKIKDENDYAGKRSAVDTATKTLYDVQRRLDALPTAAKQRTAGRPVTQAQLDRIIAAESQPLSEQARTAALGREQAAGSLSLADQAIKEYLNQFNQDSTQKYQGLIGDASDFLTRFQLGSDESQKAWQRAQAEADRKQQLDIARQQMDTQKLIASLTQPKIIYPNTPVPTPTNNTGNISIEVPDEQSFGSGIGKAIDSATNSKDPLSFLNYWKDIGKKASQKSIFDVPGRVGTLYDETLGRIFGNR